MLSKLLNKRDEKGFTIIEVLIVLAIAALILLIVFLAVPALQRNSRNTSRARDAADVLASINEYVSDNNGSLPSTCSGSNAILWGAGTTTQTTTNVSYYNKACVVATPANGDTYLITTSPAVNQPALSGNTADYLEIVEGDGCSTTTTGAAAAGTARQLVALYEIENGPGTYGSVCLAS